MIPGHIGCPKASHTPTLSSELVVVKFEKLKKLVSNFLKSNRSYPFLGFSTF